MCLQARQQMQLGRFKAVLKTVAPFLGGSYALAPSRWALHLTVHMHWLNGDLDQVCCYLHSQQLAETGSDQRYNTVLRALHCIPVGSTKTEHL